MHLRAAQRIDVQLRSPALPMAAEAPMFAARRYHGPIGISWASSVCNVLILIEAPSCAYSTRSRLDA